MLGYKQTKEPAYITELSSDPRVKLNTKLEKILKKMAKTVPPFHLIC